MTSALLREVLHVHGRIAFLEPEPTSGLITELCEVRAGTR
jgi:hypothetical protein